MCVTGWVGSPVTNVGAPLASKYWNLLARASGSDISGMTASLTEARSVRLILWSSSWTMAISRLNSELVRAAVHAPPWMKAVMRWIGVSAKIVTTSSAARPVTNTTSPPLALPSPDTV